MRIAAALILTLASSAVLADPQQSNLTGDWNGDGGVSIFDFSAFDEQGFTGNVADGNDRLRQRTAEGLSNQAITVWDYERVNGADPKVPGYGGSVVGPQTTRTPNR